MGDNDLTEFPPQIGKFKKLEIVSLVISIQVYVYVFKTHCTRVSRLVDVVAI